jgi:RimJ/RimL family protein N-acetyltransferase
MSILETERLLLRPPRAEDLDEFVALYSDPEVMRFLGGVRTREQTAERLAYMIRHWDGFGFGIRVLLDRRDVAFVGRCGISYAHALGDAELAYTLARRSWGQGLATEAARVTLEDAFSRLGLPRVVAYAEPDNTASRRVLLKLGMTPDGTAAINGRPALRYRIESGAARQPS